LLLFFFFLTVWILALILFDSWLAFGLSMHMYVCIKNYPTCFVSS
jgi:hypothetical protein